MDGLLVLLVLALLAIPILLIVALIGLVGVRGRVADAEARLGNLTREISDMQRQLRGGTPPEPKSDTTADDPARAATPAAAHIAAEPSAQAPAAAAAPPPVPPKPPQPAPPAEPPRPSPVAEALSKFGPWLQENWFYAVSALSLALAGIFLVQYGMENGLLPPGLRVLAALGFGGVLVGAGEWIRRRYGDHEDSTTAYLPSVFSGAGIVTLFGGVLSARMLYGLIGGEAAMAGMVAVALLGIFLGWLHGPLLVAVGVIGAYGAPVVLSSSNSDASPLFAYFAIVAVLGLGVDTIRRWGWISALTLVLAYFMGWILWATSGRSIDWAALLYFAVLPVLAILIPARGLRPDHAGQTVSLGFVSRVIAKAERPAWPAFPTTLAFGAVLASSILLFSGLYRGEIELWMSLFALVGLTLALTYWSRAAPALQDLPAFPAGMLLLSAFAISEDRLTLFRDFRSAFDNIETAAYPWAVTILLMMAAAITLAAAWRAMRAGRLRAVWAAAAAIYLPAMAILLEVSWTPAEVIGAYPWALHAAAIAGLMVLLAERFARRDGPDRLRVSFFVMSALSCIAFAFVIVLSSAALTIALAVTVVTAAALDRKWNLPPLSLFITVGVAVLGFRLVADPGLEFGRFGPLPEMLLAYVGTFAAFAAALWLSKGQDRPIAQVVLDSALWSTGGLTLSLLLFRWIDASVPNGSATSHWAVGLNAVIWIGLALAQAQRADLGGFLRQIRLGLAAVFGVIGLGSVFIGLTAVNPLLTSKSDGLVHGPILFNTLIPAYLLPALVLLAGAWRLRKMARPLRIGAAGIGGVLATFWAVLAVRHFWRGAEGMPTDTGFSQGELYSYTVALLLIGAGLFYQSLARRSDMMRKAGLVVIGLAVAKVFLVDISGLEGLTRVFSLLILGLSLAGLAWLNRWAKDRYGQSGPDPKPGPPPPPPIPETHAGS